MLLLVALFSLTACGLLPDRLQKAAFLGDIPEVQRLLVEGYSVNALRIDEGFYPFRGTPLTVATAEGHLDVVKLLIGRGAEVNARTGFEGATALMYAAWAGTDPLWGTNHYRRTFADIIRLLIDKGADVNARDSLGYSALMIASFCGHQNIVELLLDEGADVNAKSNDGHSALVLALYAGQHETARLLRMRGAAVETSSGHAVYVEPSDKLFTALGIKATKILLAEAKLMKYTRMIDVKGQVAEVALGEHTMRAVYYHEETSRRPGYTTVTTTARGDTLRVPFHAREGYMYAPRYRVPRTPELEYPRTEWVGGWKAWVEEY
jgi:hypothetical protein